MTRRLLASYLALTALVLLVLEVPLGIVFQQREMKRLAIGLERDAAALASLSSVAVSRGQAPAAAVAGDYATRTGVRVVITDSTGRSLLDTGAAAGRDFSTRPEIGAALAGARASGSRRSDTLGTDILYVTLPIAAGGQVHGAVRLTLETAQVQRRAVRFWLGLAAAAVVVLAAVALVGTAVARSLTRPLRDVELAVARFAGGDLRSLPPDPRAPAEIADLQATVNAMAERLARLLAEQRAFVADASHQLRTPLTALRLRLENLQSAARHPDEASDLEAAMAETTRLAALVNDLLRLAAAEKDTTAQVVDAATTVRDRVELWSAVADADGVLLALTLPHEPALVRVVPDAIEQILDNLLDNAIAASPPGGSVRIALTRGTATYDLTVEDGGPGLSDELKARALDRFWRGDTARDGSGLGLPIAQAMAAASGGSLTIEDAEGGGLRVRATLPAS